MNILYPRVDHRKYTNGITGTAFPAYEYVLALSYKITGFSHANHRILQFLIYVLGIIGLFKLGLLLFRSQWASALMAFAFAWSPEMYYHGINALPDVAAMVAVIWSLNYYVRKTGSGNLLFSIFLITIASLIKLQFALFGLAYVIDAIINRDNNRVAGLFSFGILSAGAVVNWYIHSIQIRYENNLQDYGLFLNPADSLEHGLRVLKNNLLIDIPEQVVGYGLIPLVLFGLILFIRNKSSRQIIKAILIVALFALFHIQELKQMEYHAYYMMPYILFSAYLIGLSVDQLAKSKWIWILALLIPVQLAHTVNKINPRYSDENSQLPSEFLDEQQLNKMQTILSGSDRSLVGPDPSGCIYFYYLGVKGWNVFGIDQLEEKDHIVSVLNKKNVECIAVKSMDKVRIERYGKDFKYITQVGDFTLMTKRLR